MEEQGQELEVSALGLTLLWRLRPAALLGLYLHLWAMGPGCGRPEGEDRRGVSGRTSAWRRGVEQCSLGMALCYVLVTLLPGVKLKAGASEEPWNGLGR